MIDVEETGNHSDSQPLPLTIALAPDQLEMLAARVADVFEDRRDEGFVDVDGAAAFLGMSRAAVCHLVERDRLPRHRAPEPGCCSIAGSFAPGWSGADERAHIGT